MQVPEEEKYLNTKKELNAMLVTTLGGRAAEELIFDTVTTGAANDIEKATELARNMITRFGMSEKFGLMGLAKVQDMYLTGRTSLECGDATATEIDKEVMKMLAAAYDEAKHILSENLDVLHKIAGYLIEKETITGKEFMQILHEVRGDAVDNGESITTDNHDDNDSELIDSEAGNTAESQADESYDNESAANHNDASSKTAEYEQAMTESGVDMSFLHSAEDTKSDKTNTEEQDNA